MAKELSSISTKVFNVKNYGAVADGSTDDTAAIQSAIQAAFDAGGGIVYLPLGHYIIGGALQTSVNGTNPNCQIYVPLSRFGTDQAPNIRMVGEAPPGFMMSAAAGGVVVQNKGVILESTIDGTGTRPAVFGTPTYESGQVYGAKNWTYFGMENLIIRTKTKSGSTHVAGTMSGINFQKLSNFNCDYVSVETTSHFTTDGTGMVEPTGNTYGVIMPDNYNWGWLNIGFLRIMGYTNAFVPGEHLNARQLFIAYCKTGVKMEYGMTHAGFIQGLSVELCKDAIRHENNFNLMIDHYHPEHYYGVQSLWYSYNTDHYGNGGQGDSKVHINRMHAGSTQNGADPDFVTNAPNSVTVRSINGWDVEWDLKSLTSGGTWNCLFNKRATIASGGTLTTSNARTGEVLTLLVTGGTSVTVNGTALSGSNVYTGLYDGTAWYWK